MRLAVVLAALAATAGLTYRAFQDELALKSSAAAAQEATDLADRALTTSADLRAALHAYVAPGQGSPFWVSRSGVLVEELQTGLTALAAIDPNLTPIAGEAMAKLVAAEKRARGFLRESQELLASDVIFTECRDQLDAVRLQIAGARDRILANADVGAAALRREQYMLLGAMIAAWAVCVLLLLPVPEAPIALPAPERTKPAEDDIPLVTLPPVAAAAPQPIAPPPPAPPPPVIAKIPPPPIPRLPEAAQVCADLARASDSDQIAPLLKRAADVLDAEGLIVWVTSSDGASLVPAASCGYDERLLERVGALPLDAENLTSAAFRDGARRTTAARDGAAAAIAVPLVGPTGTIGVLSGEVRNVERVGETTSALASIFAAQLATLVGSMPATESISNT